MATASSSSFISTVPVPSVDATGCHVPLFEDIYTALISDFKGIYGQDIVLDNSTQDGQWLGILALALFNYATAFLACYNAFSPSTAQGTGLSSVVKTNGITREVASYSTTTVTVIGVAFTGLTNQVISDGTYAWSLPASFTIPATGSIAVSATCQTLGAITVPQGTQAGLLTQTRGLQAVTFTGTVSPGAPVEADAALRQRQATSTELPAQGLMDAIYGAILAVPNVTRARVYENDGSGPSGNAPDANGIPAHAIAAVVDGGDNTAIATAIASRKLAAGTYGTASGMATTGSAQIPRMIYFFRPSEPPVTVVVNVKALSGFTTDVAAAIQTAVISYVNGLGIGDGTLGSIDVGRLYGPALLLGTSYAGTFTITSILIARDSGALGSNAVPIAFNEAPQASAQTVTVNPS